MKVVYNSFGGRFSDNPRAIFEDLVRRGADIDHVWVTHPQHAHGFPDGVVTTPVGSAQCRDHLEDADLVVSNTHIELDWSKAPGAVYLQTWHGTPLKRVHFDVLFAPPGRLDYLTEDVRRWDVLLSPNAASTGNLRQAFGFTGEVLETGYPRNDVLSAAGRDEIRGRVRRELGADDSTTVVLYTPTWRDDLMDGDGALRFALQLDLDEVRSRLGPGHLLLLRLHYLLSGRLGPLSGSGVLDVSFHPEIAELYLAADVMVTDYSSTMFDFAVTGKPMVFYTYDLDSYRDTVRGFYFDLADHAPGPMLSTTGEVAEALSDLDRLGQRYRNAYAAFRDRFCHLEDGGSTGRVVDRFFSADGTFQPRGGVRPHPLTAKDEEVL